MKSPLKLTIALLLCCSLSFAQTSGFDIIPYKFSKFEGDLPSGKKFYITGPLINTDKPPADVVILKIYDLGRKCSGTSSCPYYSGYYWKPADDQTNQFKIFVDRILLFSRCYKFEFEYFSTAQYTAGKNILDVFIQKLDSYFDNNPSLNSFDLVDMLAKVNTDLVDKNFGSLDFVADSGCDDMEIFQFVDEVQAVTFPIKTNNGDVTAEELAGFITDRYLVKKNAANIALYQEGIKKIAKNTELKGAISALKTNLGSGRGSIKYTQNDLDKLNAILTTGFSGAGPAPDFSPLFSDLSIFTVPQRDSLGTLDNLILSISQEYQALNQNKTKVAKAEADIGSFEDIVLKGFTLSGTSISYNQVPAFQQTVKTDATKSTTPAGISGVFLNPEAAEGPSELDAFGNAAIRTYFYPTDKRLPGKLAYVDWGAPFNRMSFTLGISVSKISYRGETLQPAVGVKPVFGLGYDVSRSFGIDVGGILFRQDSQNIFNDKSEIRFAPVFSIQFDANLFNRFKALGSGEKFQLGTQ